jgi:hypothetical protein
MGYPSLIPRALSLAARLLAPVGYQSLVRTRSLTTKYVKNA